MQHRRGGADLADPTVAEGVRWLWRHDLLRTLTIVLGLLNMLNTMAFATFVLFGQEVLGTTAVASRELALLMPWLVSGGASILLLAYAGPRLATAAFVVARSAATGRHHDVPN